MRQRLLRALDRTDRSVAVVVFTVPEERLREMAVTTGPCVPTGGRRRPLAGPSRQDGGEFPEQSSGLYTALTGLPAHEALVLLAQERHGRLFAAREPFLHAMADAQERLEARCEADVARGDRDLTTWFAERQALDRAWLAVAAWPRQVVSTAHRLERLHWARTARDRGQTLYLWHGPTVFAYEAVAPGDLSSER